MAYSAINVALVRSGKELIYTLLDLVRTNFGDHETRIGVIEGAAGVLPTGIILRRASTTVPTGYLACDGSAVLRVTYAALFAVVGTTYGVGDGSTTFNVPDLRGRVPIGSGLGVYSGATSHARGTTEGEETHLLSAAEMPVHAHTITDAGHTHTYPPGQTNTAGGGPATFGLRDFSAGVIYDPAATASTDSATTGITVGNTGGGGSHNNMQPSNVCAYVIKA